MIYDPRAEWIIVIDTNSYAGNFERSMCGYVTGQFGVCGVGRTEAGIFLEEEGMDGHSLFEGVADEEDEHGNARPCSIYDGSDDRNSVAIFFYDKPTAKMVEVIKRRTPIFAKQHKIKIEGYRLIHNPRRKREEMEL